MKSNNPLSNKKAIVLIPLISIFAFLASTIILFQIYKASQINLIVDNYYETLKVNSQSGKQDLLNQISLGNRTSNYKLNDFGKQEFDANQGTDNDFNILDNVIAAGDKGTSALENTQIIDKMITNRTTKLERIGKDAPSKKNNVFEIDLINFLKVDDSGNQNNLDDLKLLWGSKKAGGFNAPEVYLIMTRIKKGSSIDLSGDEINDYELLSSKKNYGSGIPQYGQGDETDKLAVDYLKAGGGACIGVIDYDIPDASGGTSDDDNYYQWCKEVGIDDILSGTSLDLDHYIYRVFIVFSQVDNGAGSDSSVPFKIYSETNGTFGVGNMVQADLTLLSSSNTKKRIFIKTSTKNNILPYLTYSLRVKGKIIFENEES